MSYRLDNFGNIIKDYITEEGEQGMQIISLPVLASRMALLGLEDPGAALDALAAEMDLPPGVEPPLNNVIHAAEEVVYAEAPAPNPRMRSVTGVPEEVAAPPANPEELSAHPVVVQAQAQCLAELPVSMGPDGVHDAEFKDSVRQDLGGQLEGLRRDYLKHLIPRPRS